MTPRVHALLGLVLAGLLAGAEARAQAAGSAAAPPPAPAPEQPAPPGPRTGDAVVDARLADIDRYAARFPEAFADELVRYFNAPRALVAGQLEGGQAPGELYYACALAHVTGRPCRGVLDARAAAPGAPWEEIARGLGVAPGGARAARLREAIAASYARWARPLPD